MPLQNTSGNDTTDAYGGGVAAKVNYIENYFQTWLRTGTGASTTVTTGLDASTNKALVWTKSRSAATDHKLTDTVRGATKALISDTTGAQTTDTNGLTAFSSTGYTIGTDTNYNNSGATYVDWEFVAAPKFFDVVTYTGAGGVLNVSHSLGSVPGCIIVKETSAANGWRVYHQSLGNTGALILNSTAAFGADPDVWNNTSPTSTQFTVGNTGSVNGAAQTYVAYIFAHNAGGFGLTGTENVISCGSFTSDGSGFFTATLGYGPQWVMYKQTNASDDWKMIDTMRGMTNPYTNGARLLANDSAAEGTGNGFIEPTATGFYGPGTGAARGTYIYIAIRRGPMKVPTTGTNVFTPILDSSSQGTTLTTNFPVDAQIIGYNTTTGYYKQVNDRLRGAPSPNATTPSEPYSIIDSSAEANDATRAQSWDNVSYQVPSYYASVSTIYYNFRRAPSFFDEVCYKGTGSAQNVAHNLSVVPELIIVKDRTNASNWYVLNSMTGSTYSRLFLDATTAISTTSYGSSTALASQPTTTNIPFGSLSNVSISGDAYVAYLFATCAGVSKVGNYTGNGSTQAIACGFAGGARFVLIKRTDSTGNWYVYDTARGMTTLTDPYLLLNSPAAETATLGSVTTTTGGFTVNASILSAINTSSATYIFLAIA